jgi:hypothetical protein
MRRYRFPTHLAAIAVGFGATLTAQQVSHAASLTVSFVPSASTVYVGDTVSVDIYASIEGSEALAGWGMQMSFDNAIVSHDPNTQIALGGDWFGPGTSLFGTAANLFNPPTGANILLATVEFTALALGSTNLVGSIDPLDPFQGFTFPAPPGDPDLFNVTFVDGIITVVPIPLPAPVWMGLAGLGGVVVLRRRLTR